MTKQEVIDLMSSSKSELEWNTNAKKVKDSNNGFYPDWWYGEIIASGLINRIMGPGSDEVKISSD